MSWPADLSGDALPAVTPTLDDEERRTPSAITAIYRRLAPVYDLVYGIGLEHGRRCAARRLDPRAGERILEVGIGTGLSARDYPPDCRVAGIDLSADMLARARRRLQRLQADHVSLCRMDASALAFPDGHFDAVYAPYVLNVAPDPLRVAREMRRVCRPGGRIVLLNHFAPQSGVSRLGRLSWSLAARICGLTWHVQLGAFLDAAGLTASSIDHVNCGISSVVLCHTSRGDHP